MALNWTQKLRKAADERQALIVCSVAPYDGQPVEYAPRYTTDRQPWVIWSKTRRDPKTGKWEVLYRYSGRECHAVLPKETNADQ